MLFLYKLEILLQTALSTQSFPPEHYLNRVSDVTNSICWWYHSFTSPWHRSFIAQHFRDRCGAGSGVPQRGWCTGLGGLTAGGSSGWFEMSLKDSGKGWNRQSYTHILSAVSRHGQISGRGLEKSVLLVNGISQTEDRVVRNKGGTHGCPQAEDTEQLGILSGCWGLCQ